MADVQVLLRTFHRLVHAGHSLLVIEHNLDFISQADWVIDLGPEGGAAGGELVVAGPPEKIMACQRSYTGQFLRRRMADAAT
jgi:excinuclease ABC subunit A